MDINSDKTRFRPSHAIVLAATAMASTWAGWRIFERLAAGPLASDPVLVIDAVEHDFGEVAAGPALTARFRVTNAGRRDLLLAPRKACSACRDDDEPDLPFGVAPGESIELVEALSTRAACGPISREAVYTSNDPERPTLRLTLRATAPPCDRTGSPQSPP